MTTMITSEQSRYYIDESNRQTASRPWIGNLPAVKETFTFAVLGDRCGLAIPGVFEKAARLVKQLKPDFVLGVGDLVEGYTDDEEQAHAEWTQMEAILEGMNVPFFPTVGNHDYGTDAMIKVYRERKGYAYYAFRYGQSLFLFLNTEEVPKTMGVVERQGFRQMADLMSIDPSRVEAIIHEHYSKAAEAAIKKGNVSGEEAIDEPSQHDLDLLRNAVSEEQLAFFEKVLADNADADWTYVSMHVPAWKTKNEPFAKLEAMLAGRNHTMFAGHLHMLELHPHEQGDRIQLGRTGAIKHGSGNGDAEHILWVSVENGRPTVTVLELNGAREIKEYSMQ